MTAHARVRSVPITSLTPDTRNANKGTERGERMLEDSLRKYGGGRSILADKHGNLIAGNKTYGKAGELGLPIIEVESDGTSLIVVKRTDLDLYDPSDTRARELAYADNRIQEVDYQLDPTILKEDLANPDMDLGWMYSSMEMEQFLHISRVEGLSDDDETPLGREDEAEALLEKWNVEPGQLWVIGAHRLLCGDSENPDHVARLLDGALPNLMVTDPPYGANYDPEWRSEASEKGYEGFLNKASRRTGRVDNDDKYDWREAYKLFPGNVAYVWHSSVYASAFQDGLEEAGFIVRNQIIWAKSNHVISRGHYHWQHEPCWYAVRKGQTASWQGDHKQSTLWDNIPGDASVEGGHSTQKPLECMMRPLINHQGDVYDPFVGTGTTIAAAERMGVRCYAMDVNPAYVAVSLQRCSDMGLSPSLSLLDAR